MYKESKDRSLKKKGADCWQRLAALFEQLHKPGTIDVVFHFGISARRRRSRMVLAVGMSQIDWLITVPEGVGG